MKAKQNNWATLTVYFLGDRWKMEINRLKSNVIILCKKRAVTLTQLAQAMGITKQGLHRTLSRPMGPYNKTLAAIAKQLEVDVDDLYTPIDLAEYGAVVVPRHKEKR